MFLPLDSDEALSHWELFVALIDFFYVIQFSIRMSDVYFFPPWRTCWPWTEKGTFLSSTVFLKPKPFSHGLGSNHQLSVCLLFIFFKVFHKIPAVSPKDWLGPAFLVSEWSRGPSYRQMLYLNGSWRQGTLIIFFLWRAGLLPSLISIPFSVLLPGPGSPCIKMLLTHLHPEEMWASERHCRIQKCMIPLLNQ